MDKVKAAVIAVREGQLNEENRSLDFTMRPEQKAAVEKTAAYFTSWRNEKGNRQKPPHFLWNAKMRFGKTFAAYQLAKRMGWRKVLVLTFKPAVQSAWEEDLKRHVDFKGWQFISPGGLCYEKADKNVDETNAEKKVEEFISFLPVLAYDGSSMKQIDAAGILDMAMSGTTATLLARRWESALLVNVDNETLRRLMHNSKAMDALMSIEAFRNLNQEIETIINKSDAVKKARREANDEELSEKEKKELTEQEKEYKSLRKQIQEKLIKFATRVPIFMYLTDYRERSLKDVITQLEPGLFKKVTGLTVTDFSLLVSLGLFNSALMNDAVYKFKRYEDASLTYTGINKHEGEDVGLYDTVITRKDAEKVFESIPARARLGR